MTRQRTSSVSRTRVKVAAIGAALLMLVGCAGGSGGTPSESSGSGSVEGTVIGISYPYVDNAFYQTLISIIEEEARAAGLEPLPVTDAGGDTSKQLSDIQTLISRGAKALVIQAQDSNALASAVSAASAKGIPVTSPNVGINSPDVINIRPDNRAMAALNCEALGEALGGKGKVYFQGGDLSGAAGVNRWEGFRDCIEENYPEISITFKESKWDPATAATQMETTLGADPDYQAIVMASDTIYTSVVIATLTKLGLLAPAGEPGHIYVTGIDGSPEALDAVRDGYVDSVVSEPLPEEGRLSIYYLVEALQGRTFEPGPTDHGTEIVEEDGVLTDVVPAVLVTDENVDDADLWGNQAK